MKKILYVLLAAILYLSQFTAESQVHQKEILDPTFGNNGLAIFDSSGWEGAWDAVVSNDGKIIIAGWRSETLESENDILLIRFNSDGSLDTTFESGYFISVGEYTWEASYAVKLQVDEKILVAGISFSNDSWDFLLVRFHENGSIDSSFGNNGFVARDVTEDDRAFAIDIQNDGKIVLAGLSTINDWDFAVLRFNTDGTPDPSFGNNGIVITDFNNGQDVAFSVKTQSDGKIIACGWTYGPNDFDFALIRYNNDGSLDNSFGNNGKVTTDFFGAYNSAHSIDIQEDGKYIVAGYTYYLQKPGFDVVIARYNTDGSLDDSFGDDGVVITNLPIGNSFSWKVKIQYDQKIVVSGLIEINNVRKFLILRYNNDGSLDKSFGDNGYFVTGIHNIDAEGRGLTIQRDGKIIVTGYSFNGSDIDAVVIRLNTIIPSVPAELPTLPDVPVLFNNYPNPFNSTTIIPYYIPERAFATIKVYDLLGKAGQILIDEEKIPGFYEVLFSPEDMASGIYFFQLQAAEHIETKQMIYIR